MSSSVLDAFREKVGSGNESIDMLNGKFTVTRIFQGPYLDRIKFVKEFLNRTAKIAISGGSIRLPFQEHPKHKGLFATRAEIKGTLGADITAVTGTFEYETAIVTIKYQALNFQQPQGGQSTDFDEKPILDFVEETSDASIEILQIPGEDIVCDDIKQHDQGPKNHIVVFLNINIRQPFVAKPHWDEIMNNLGKVNDNVFFTPGGKVAPKGKILYEGPSDSIRIDALAPRNFLWDISHKFVYNRDGWHFKWCDGGFKEINPHIYEEGDLMSIFFGRDGGPAIDALDELEAKQNQIDAKIDDIQVEKDKAGGGDPGVLRGLEDDLRVLYIQRSELIRGIGGNLLDNSPLLAD